MKIESLSTTLINITNHSGAGAESSASPIIALESSIRLDKNVTLIRGSNGSGKTVIAEALSLLGHSSIIPFKEDDHLGGTPLVAINLSFSDNDVKFLNHLKVFINDPSKKSLLIGNHRFSFDELGNAGIRKAFAYLGDLHLVPESNSPFRVEFWKTKQDFDLKKILANDHLLEKHLRLRAFGSDNEDFGNALRWLIAWNRPRLIGPKSEKGPWTQAPRYILDQSESKPKKIKANSTYPKHPPGPVGYFNTDMYDFGAGLDIRESPKEMRSHMTTALVDRLQLVSSIGCVDAGLLSKKIEGAGQNYLIREIGAIEQKWTELFGDPFAKLKLAQPLKIRGIKSQGKKLIWGENEKSQEFMSSGENQAFFALCYVENFQISDSFLILDEPELHLSIKAASTLIEDIVNIAHEKNTQVVIVTHLPHLFYQAVVDDDKYKLIYLDRNLGGDSFVGILEGKKAFIASSRDSHIQVDHLVQNLRSVQSPSIWFWRGGISSFLARTQNYLFDHPRLAAILLIGLMAGMGALACMISN